MATFDVWLPLQSGRRKLASLMSAIDPKATYNAALMAIEASQLVHGFKVALDDFFTCLTEDRQGGKMSYPAAISLI